ncbi:hypothetical protein N7470_008322 [Penicillium chermesinum]|nr:hypothetical protein N7470_008322 [Penicillium chermesinum]
MPPPNSASNSTPLRSSTEPLEPRHSSNPDSPVPAENEAHDENVNFLRAGILPYASLIPALSRHRRRRVTSHPELMEGEDRMEVDDPSHLRLSVEINRRTPAVHRQREDSANMPNYEGLRSNPRLLYGWAPGAETEDDDLRHHDESEDDQIQPFLATVRDRSGLSSQPQRHESTARAQPSRGTEDASEASRTGRERTSWDPSISTMEALLQSARRQPRLPRTRTLESYLLDRYTPRETQTTVHDSDETERPAGSSSRAYRYRPSRWGDARGGLTHGDLRSRASAHRQGNSAASGDSILKDIINYLGSLRDSNSLEESINSAATTGIGPATFSNDFILDTNTIPPPPSCSFLRPGAIFGGCQKAAHLGCSIVSQRVPSPHTPASTSTPGEPVIVNGSDSARISVQTSSGRRYLANPRDERWPVVVTIHSIDYSEMTLSGTMEAYNIPDKSVARYDAHIVTFLEGEIIDFNKHTLETKNFKADADIDSTYWRELQPFKDLSDAEVAKNLVSRKWVTEELAKGWILMRWKERCFITPTDARQGLTISGFYYISLSRETGEIEGLYYDPGSSPYQQLSLKPRSMRMQGPAYSFR